MIYTETLNEALKLCTTTEVVPTVVKDALLELVQKVQASSQDRPQGMGTDTAARCQCGKAT